MDFLQNWIGKRVKGANGRFLQGMGYFTSSGNSQQTTTSEASLTKLMEVLLEKVS